MTQIPAGWYPDPDPTQTDPGVQRYWDGTQWTEHVQAPSAPPAYVGPGNTYGAPPLPSTADGRATTPDGQVLAGWWSRVAAYLLDLVITTPIVILLALPWVRDIVSTYADFMSEVMDAAESGAASPSSTAVLDDVAGATLAVSLIALLVQFVYHVGFLKWKAATPGKLALGLRVRLRETPGPLSWATVLLRWVGQFGYTVLGVVPVLGSILSLYPVVDLLWPLWDRKKQALHDKVAKTNVVRIR